LENGNANPAGDASAKQAGPMLEFHQKKMGRIRPKNQCDGIDP